MDIYDKAIEALLTLDNEEFNYTVERAWHRPDENYRGSLFTRCGPLPFMFEQVIPPTKTRHIVGCLTQVREGGLCAFTNELTDKIRADERLPSTPWLIIKDSLPVFAEWQRKLDQIYPGRYERLIDHYSNSDHAFPEELINA